jgi:hypothetical protein
MINNKQNSVEWLFEEQFNSFEKFNNGEFSFSEYMAHNLTLREQAKAMHKEEVVEAVKYGFNKEYFTPNFRYQQELFEQYYNETFGDNNEKL